MIYWNPLYKRKNKLKYSNSFINDIINMWLTLFVHTNSLLYRDTVAVYISTETVKQQFLSFLLLVVRYQFIALPLKGSSMSRGRQAADVIPRQLCFLFRTAQVTPQSVIYFSSPQRTWRLLVQASPKTAPCSWRINPKTGTTTCFPVSEIKTMAPSTTSLISPNLSACIRHHH